MKRKYKNVVIFTSESARYKGKPLCQAIINYMKDLKIHARTFVSKGIAGSYENGEIAHHAIEIISVNMPLRIEIILPSAELDGILEQLKKIVQDGIITVNEMNIVSYKTKTL